MNSSEKKYVVIGGGTGTYSVLKGLKKHTSHITAIVTMADSGGSAKKERDEWGLLPSSDIRKSLLALSDVSTEDNLLLRELFQYRYSEGEELSGMTFGNLFIATLAKLLGSQEKAIEKSGNLLKIKGKVLPVSLAPVDLVAKYADGTEVVGEHFIDEPQHNGTIPIVSLSTRPEATVTDEAAKAILEADAVIIGPGGFYTTLLANLVIKGVSEAIIKSHAKKIFILNLMSEYGQTYGFTAKRFIQELSHYIPENHLTAVLINNGPIPEEILARYKTYKAEPVVNDLGNNNPFTVMEKDFLSKEKITKQKGDTLKRSLVRHDPEKLAEACIEIVQKNTES